MALVGGVGVGRAQSQPKEVSGVPNFGRVSDALLRGAQPTEAGFAALKAIGVGMIVNFRDDAESAGEQRQVESLGMKYVSIPWSGRDNPSNKQVAQFLDLVRSNPQAKIFVHCRAGADRTGTMVAAYRIAMEHVTVANALKEMHSFHYHHFFLPQLERYIDSFPQTLTADSLFSAYMSPALLASSATPTNAAPAVMLPAVAAAPLLH
jgi:protein tyrosine/serine phosphatase